MGEELAILSPQEVFEKKRVLKNAWEAYVSDHKVVTGVRGSVLESWKRSQSFGIQPGQRQARYAQGVDEVIEWRKESEFFATAIPILEQVYSQIEETRHILTLTEAHGRIIYLRGNHHILEKAEAMRFTLGADWSEQSAGTNAIGTSVYLKKPIQIFSYEHFAQGAHDWVCSASPVYDEHSGKLLGIVDLTAPHEYAQPHTLSMAKMIATQIQAEYLRISNDIRRCLHEEYVKARNRWPHEPMLLFDGVFQVIAENAEAQAWLRTVQPSLPDQSVYAVIRDALLTCAGSECTFELLQTGYKVTATAIVRRNERIGFLVLLHPRSRPRLGVSRGSFEGAATGPWVQITGRSPAIQTAIQRAKVVAATNVPILITGESGTGKELFARAVHEASPRRHHPFIAVNIAALPRELMASELFGYEPGAFTGAHPRGKKGKFEEAHGGTLFLDEIGDMPLDLQVYLLRVLQEKKVTRLGASHAEPVDVRIIAATHQHLAERIVRGAFRQDLFYRINVVELALPPLRERAGDIVLIANHFLAKFARQYGRPVTSFAEETLRLFTQYDWPGNVRELQNAVEHAVIFSQTDTITRKDLPSYLQVMDERAKAPHHAGAPVEHPDPWAEEERKLIAYWLEKLDGNVSEVARRLRRSRSTIYRKMKQYGIDSVRFPLID
ncbi:sigma-54-dependent Fis family transcriptional regulator [Alicyclobacillus macrosporangiidus]|uniref:Transcriptional regulator of acetoin/glycerol metabolism n=1 Tax=Alicyclobacillus macrosporangiidus TaxID=392015 RepID=A0A1I7G9B5_9BACL|nr:sigma-54-dependent Fis family transcriptional regulator [Alicyclobacillus macrosporangiidus]SFU45012.1 Transcriptional regulator of acetoin/glycerol metabolism [Alicyclobacillus macrosporangiidus]